MKNNLNQSLCDTKDHYYDDLDVELQLYQDNSYLASL